MSALRDITTVVLVSGGVIFFLAGTVGLLRFPDQLTRLHALTKADNLGLGMIAFGLMPRADSALSALKLIVVWALVLLSGASTSQFIGRALRRGRK